jgi:hypothetical protein
MVSNDSRLTIMFLGICIIMIATNYILLGASKLIGKNIFKENFNTMINVTFLIIIIISIVYIKFETLLSNYFYASVTIIGLLISLPFHIFRPR